MSAAVITGTLLALLLLICYIFIQRLATFWKRRNVPVVGGNIIFGAFKDVVLMKRTQGECFREAYEKNPHLKFYGTFFYGRPTLVVQDHEIVKQILSKDFQNFASHGFYVDSERDPLSGHLFSLDGAKWKSMRNKLTVSFTTGKMKGMFETMRKCIERLGDVMDKELEKGNVFDMRERIACLGVDIIATVAFGIEVNSLEDPNTSFRVMAREMFTPKIQTFFRFMTIINMHWLARLFNVRILNPRPYNFIMDMAKKTVEYREKNNVVRNDFMNMMLQLKNQGYVDVDGNQVGLSAEQEGSRSKLTFNELAAQVFVFFAAGFEPPSLLSTFVLYELAVNKDIQKKVQEECDQVLLESGNKITYESIQTMEYTEKVIYETLRFFSPMGALVRSTTNECTLPLTNIKLDKNTSIAIPTQGFHMDPRFFPDPETFDPERFSEEQKALRPPNVYMPFGDGPRICIGMRFALVQVKAVLLRLLSKYNFELTKDTPVPIKLDPKGLNTTPGKLAFVVTKRT